MDIFIGKFHRFGHDKSFYHHQIHHRRDRLQDLTLATPRILTATEFQGLADMPPELEWFANITNPQTRRAYKTDITDFSRFAGITAPEQMRLITRAHVIAWRDALGRRQLAGATNAPQALRACLAVQLPVRAKRGYSQSRARRETPNDHRQRR